MDAVRVHSKACYRYLGSWHTHPGAPARPSATDIATTAQVASESEVLLPRPLLLIQATRLSGRSAQLRELRAWRWDTDADWVMPLQIESCRLPERYCPVVTVPAGRHRANRTLRPQP